MPSYQHLWAWVKAAAREHWLALLVLFAPINWVVYQSDADTVVPLLLLPLAALGVGYALRPHHVWIVSLGSVLLVWIVVGYMGKYDDPGEETVASIMLEAFVSMVLGVLTPVWIGRLIRNETGDRRQAGRIGHA